MKRAKKKTVGQTVIERLQKHNEELERRVALLESMVSLLNTQQAWQSYQPWYFQPIREIKYEVTCSNKTTEAL